MTTTNSQDVYVAQLYCLRCNRMSAILSPKDSVGIFKELTRIGFANLCPNCFEDYKIGVAKGEKMGMYSTLYREIKPDGSVTDKAGFDD